MSEDIDPPAAARAAAERAEAAAHRAREAADRAEEEADGEAVHRDEGLRGADLSDRQGATGGGSTD